MTSSPGLLALSVLAASLVLGGCAATPRTPSAARSPSSSSPASAAIVASVASTTIPEGLTLPDEVEGKRERPTTRLYTSVCLDPRPALVDVMPTDERTISTRWSVEGGGVLIERLAVYADADASAEAVADLGRELRRCGRTRSHSGALLVWHRAPADATPVDADEAWHFYDIVSPAAGESAFVSVMRVGTAVYLEDRRVTSDLTDREVVDSLASTGEERLGAFVAELCVFAEAGC